MNCKDGGGPECPLCSEEGRFACGGCGDVFYCSREHQRLHWGEEHSYECRSYKIMSSPKAGRYLVASRNMKAGKLIFSDEPLAVGPLSMSDTICLGCLSEIEDKIEFRCPDCFWPMCSRECALRKEHEEECQILMTDKGRYGVPQRIGPNLRYDIILLIRCLLLKTTNPKNWDILQNLVSHSKQRKLLEDPYHVAATRYVTEVLKTELDLEVVRHVRGVIMANVLEVRGPKGNKVRAVYPTFSLMNHSCIPNVHLTILPNSRLEARAAVDIDKGDDLFTTYTETTSLRWDRQTTLSENHFFTCMCKRCSDPSELGTYFSCPRCPQCVYQYMLPQVLWDPDLWICRKCKGRCTTEDLVQEIDDWTFRMDMDELFGTATPNKIAVALSQVERSFHDRHFLFVKAAQIALQKLKTNNSWDGLKLKKDIWERLMKIYDTLEAGLTRRRGMALVELGRICNQIALVALKDEDTCSSQNLVDNYQLEAKDYFNQAYEILKYEPKCTPEFKLLTSLRQIAYG